MIYCFWLDDSWKIVPHAVAKLDVVNGHLQFCTQLFVVIRLYTILLWEWCIYSVCVVALMAKEFGRVVVITRDGKDGPAFSLKASVCHFGRWDHEKNYVVFYVLPLAPLVFWFCIFCNWVMIKSVAVWPCYKCFLNLWAEDPLITTVVSHWVCGSVVGQFSILCRNSLTSGSGSPAVPCTADFLANIYSWKLYYECMSVKLLTIVDLRP